MKNFDLRSIMCRAWEIYHEADQGDGLRPVFSLCLAMAWEDAKNAPKNIIHQWTEMTDAAQIKLLTANVKKAIRNETAGILTFSGLHEIDAFVNEAWIKIAERLDPEYLDKLNAKRAAAGKQNISLVALAYRAAKDAVRVVYRDDAKRENARVREITDTNGERRDYLETMASTGRDETGNAATLRTALEQFINSRDEIDRTIIDCKRDDFTEREIAEVVGMTCAAVHKRIVRLREALRAAGLTPAEAAA